MALAIILLAPVSCEEKLDTELSVSVMRSAVSYEAGSHLVTVRATGSWTLELQGVDGSADWAGLNVYSGSGNSTAVVLSYSSNATGSSRTLMIVLRCGSREAVCTFTQAAAPDGGGGSGSGGSGGSGGEDGSIPLWLELPAMSQDDGLKFYSHDMTIVSTATRNYSFCWDASNKLSIWVAYPLNVWNIGTGSRTDEWEYDPLVPKEEQPMLYKGFNRSTGNYDRGHQLPSADRLASGANEQTFYFTNMTPQLASLNQRLWMNFEGTVRDWARQSDTLYVVTGCTIDGSLGVAYDNAGAEVTVPGGYFKAILRYAKATTLGTSGYMGAAFFIEHKGYEEKNVTAAMSMSIDELEELTGIDFFVNLEGAIGADAAARVEAERPASVSWWGLN